MGNLTYQAGTETLDDYSPVPAGTYLATITESEVKDTKAGTGSYAWLKFEIMDGENKGRMVFDMITITNPNAQAVTIGQKQLNTLLMACRLQGVSDTSELHGHAILIDVKIKQQQGKDSSGNAYAPQNEINNYHQADANTPKQESMGDAVDQAEANVAKQEEPAATTTEETPPWA